MISRHAKIIVAAFCVVVFPLVMQLLIRVAPDVGLIWLLPHQLYYLPMSWLGEPFFTRDSDVGFWVQWPGRVLTAFLYVLAVFGVAAGFSRLRQRGARV